MAALYFGFGKLMQKLINWFLGFVTASNFVGSDS
jgi:hypothetical protein